MFYAESNLTLLNPAKAKVLFWEYAKSVIWIRNYNTPGISNSSCEGVSYIWHRHNCKVVSTFFDMNKILEKLQLVRDAIYLN